MPSRRSRALTLRLGGAAVFALCAVVSVHAETIQPDQITYDATTSEDPAAKACTLEAAMKGNAVGETVKFQLVVARTKRHDTFAGPAVFGFMIAVHDRQFAAGRTSEPRPVELTSVAFTSERFTAAARPRTVPFADGSWVASTLDTAEGGELVDAAAGGKFQIAYTRTRPIAARIFDVTSAPPLDVLVRFSGCIDGLQVIE